MTATEARRIYQREWRARNKDKVRASNERFWQKKAAELDKKLKTDAEKEA